MHIHSLYSVSDEDVFQLEKKLFSDKKIIFPPKDVCRGNLEMSISGKIKMIPDRRSEMQEGRENI